MDRSESVEMVKFVSPSVPPTSTDLHCAPITGKWKIRMCRALQKAWQVLQHKMSAIRKKAQNMEITQRAYGLL